MENTVHINDVVGHGVGTITVHIKGVRWWNFKIWIAFRLVKLGCRIGGFNNTVYTLPEDKI